MAAKSRQQVGDQTVKGGLLGILAYLGNKAGLDPEFIALCLPVFAAIFAWASTQIGDPNLASIFDSQTRKTGVVSAVKTKLSKK